VGQSIVPDTPIEVAMVLIVAVTTSIRGVVRRAKRVPEFRLRPGFQHANSDCVPGFSE
jgi:hypothetical protein